MRSLPRQLLVLLALGPVACGGPTNTAPPSAASVTEADAAGIVWLCMPGRADNPCTEDLSTTAIDPAGQQTTSKPVPATDPPIDCFYVYPTTSRQTTINADLSIDPEERGVAAAQAALFSQVCRVYAPIYPQLTIAGINSGRITSNNVQTAYEGVRAAFDDYLTNYNHGRGFIFIGHSQGAMLLANLMHFVIDANADLRKLMVSSLLMGGNVTVAAGKTTGGDFENIPACASASQTGCVVGFSTFAEEPPANAAFGRVSGAIEMLMYSKPGEQQILCVNPAAPGGGSGALLPHFATRELARLADAPKPAPTTAFVAYANQLTAECKTSGDATWLQITRAAKNGPLPAIAGSEGPRWGLHDHDLSLTLGNLVELARSQAAAFVQ